MFLDDMKKVIVRKTNDSILIITGEAKTYKGNRSTHVTITADEIHPILLSEAKERNLENLREYWKDVVYNGGTEQSQEDWIETVLCNDGEISTIDTSLYMGEIEINGETYVFESDGCGCMHDDILKYAPETWPLVESHNKTIFDQGEIYDIVRGYFYLKHKMKNEDVDQKVLEYAKQLI
jgi:hypothetical protein